ncbi:P-loop containing nucleoside triphosphate hydrolase protein [Xylaria arbuscula]|nr:P-loop containing nucleoside triphosphate hydrolase protein [Xylaria arbuscula]
MEVPAPGPSKIQQGDQKGVDNNSNSVEANIESKKERVKVCRVDKVWDAKARKFRYVKTAKPKDEKKFHRIVIRVARLISDKGTFTGRIVLDFRAEYLLNVLNEIYQDVDGVEFHKSKTLDNDDLPLLYHARQHLHDKLRHERKSESSNENLIFELEAMLQFVEEEFTTTISTIREISKGLITFPCLWTLFPPGVLVFSTNLLNQNVVFRLRSAKYRELRDKSKVFTLELLYLDFNGSKIGFVAVLRDIVSFDGAVSIPNLEYFPIDRHPNFPALQHELVQRGERLLHLHGQHFKECRGQGLQEATMDANLREPYYFNPRSEASAADKTRNKFDVSGRIMIDPAAFQRLQPGNAIIPRIRRFLDTNHVSSAEKMILKPTLYGFSFKEKIWGEFPESSITDVEWNESAINSLVLAHDRKEFIQVLVKARSSGNTAAGFDDFIHNKGKGLLELLAGPPGVGKTMTAEAIAEIAHRPLYMISSGELGETSSAIQEGLSRVMKLAEIWHAVVLLDEADVFLSERSNIDLSRNAITSIFLRHLEYYEGIMLLTTNRVKSLDPAFKSRIHFCLDYPDLSFESRRQIWSNYILKVPNTIEVVLQDEDLDTLAQENLNGRQIKNVMSLSASFAREKQQAIDIKTVLLAIGFSQGGWPSEF